MHWGPHYAKKIINFDQESKPKLRLLQKRAGKEWGAQQAKHGFFSIMIQRFKHGLRMMRVSILCSGNFGRATGVLATTGVSVIRKKFSGGLQSRPFLLFYDTSIKRAGYIKATDRERSAGLERSICCKILRHLGMRQHHSLLDHPQTIYSFFSAWVCELRKLCVFRTIIS